MDSVVRRGCFVLFWVGLVTALHTTTTVELKKTHDEVGTGCADKNVDDLRTRLDTLELNFKKLTQLPTSEIQNEDCKSVVKLLTEHYSSIDERLKELQMKFDVQVKTEERRIFLMEFDEAMKVGSLKLVQDKLIQSGDTLLVPEVVHRLYVNSESFDKVIDFSGSLSVWTFRYEMLKALHDEMRSLGHLEDPAMLLKLLQAFENQLIEEVADGGHEDDMINVMTNIYRLEDSIKRSGADYLIKAMKSGAIVKSPEYHQFLNDLYELRPDVSEEVVKRVINGTYDAVKTNILLTYITKNFNIQQAIEGISGLFWKIQQYTGLNNTNVLEIASNVKKIQAEHPSINSAQMEVLEKVIHALPICARNIIFAPTICIWNSGRKAYLEASVEAYNHDITRRNIFTNPIKDSDISGARWLVKNLNGQFYFRSKLYPNEYMYAAQYDYSPDAHYVFNWVPGNNTDSQSAFLIELRGDYCYLKSAFFNEYLMASSVKYKKDHELSYVFAWRKGGPDDRPEFEWQIHNCE